MDDVVFETDLEGVDLLFRGKVRDVYDLGSSLLIVATDRISAYDSILPTPIPFKGKVLNQISAYWFNYVGDVIENHVIETDHKNFPKFLSEHSEILAGRSMIVKKTERIDVECVVRGYLSGSAWEEYQDSGEVVGIELPEGLVESEKLPEPIFTPAIKSESGHDINVSEEEIIRIIGEESTAFLKDKSIELYTRAFKKAESCGIILADTKFEFGFLDGEIILIDEIFTPDSSRFWDIGDYAAGSSQKSFDKQFVRDYLKKIGWDKEPPAPDLPEDIVRRTSEKYAEAYRRLTGVNIL